MRLTHIKHFFCFPSFTKVYYAEILIGLETEIPGRYRLVGSDRPLCFCQWLIKQLLKNAVLP